MNTPLENLEDVVREMTDINLKSACRALLQDPQFKLWPASIGHHHNYPGGLAEHTDEVLDFALRAAAPFSGKVDLDVLIAACLWHDYAKVFEYELRSILPAADPPADSLRYRINEGMVEYWVKSDYLKRVGHIAGSTMVFYHTASLKDVRTDKLDAVCHCILAHHGPVVEWGSPVAPQSLEAYLLHHADMLSARFGGKP